jgi:2-polyprenyl-3-methyl-5-hydroxy-6-metoxy-1,4-benzoquinol methylase
MTISEHDLANSRRTIGSYERYARDYDALVSPTPPPDVEVALQRLAKLAGPGGRILEVGSGPGRDADFLESLGLQVRRTDATRAFLALQAERGKRGELLNLLTDDLSGPYDGVLAMCVLIHIERAHIDLVLGKIAGALRPAGALLTSVREGAGETTGDYHTTYWRREDFVARLEHAGLRVVWHDRHLDSDEDPWLTFLAVSGQ